MSRSIGGCIRAAPGLTQYDMTMATEWAREFAGVILDQAADAVIFADTEGVIRVWNAAATRVFGFTAEEALGHGLDLIIPAHLRQAHWTGFNRAMQSGATRLAGRPTMTRGLHKSGRPLYVEMSSPWCGHRRGR